MQRIEDSLGGRVPPGLEMPVLRMARPLEEEKERAEDPTLDRLLRWATTVVRLPLLPGAAVRLGHDIAGNRAQGSIRSPRASCCSRRTSAGSNWSTSARSTGSTRDHRGARRRAARDPRKRRGASKPEIARWRVHSVAHEPSTTARGSAGELHDRGIIDVSWAVPEYTVRDGLCTFPPRRGEFWSFFPTKYTVSLSGYLNAAWKTNEDRQNLLDGSEFNQELLGVAARLVAESLPELSPAEDPGAYLPLLPGRSREAINWADKYLLEKVWSELAACPSLPDQTGRLCVPNELNIHPAGLDRTWVAMWAEYPGRPKGWVHHSVEASTVRRGKVEHILDDARHRAEDVRTWLEALVTDGTPEASATAIRIVSAMITAKYPKVEEARQARIVLTESHGMVAPRAGEIFHRTAADTLRDDMVHVDHRIADRPELGVDLHVIGVRVADAQGRFEGVLDQGFAHYTADDWAKFWVLLRSAGGNAQVERIRIRTRSPLDVLHVRTVDGMFRPMRDCLLPGPVVPADGSRDATVSVDMAFHAADGPILRDLRLLDRSSSGHRPDTDSAWFAEYQQAVHDAYVRSLPADAPRPTRGRLSVEGAPTAGPLHLLLTLSDEGRAAFLETMPDSAVVESWMRQYGSQTSTRGAVASPLRWMLNKYGLVRTSEGLVAIREAVGPQLEEYADVLPVARISAEKAHRLRMPLTADEVPVPRWNKLLDRVLESEDDVFVGRAYALLMRVGTEFPEGVLTRCRIGGTWAPDPTWKSRCPRHAGTTTSWSARASPPSWSPTGPTPLPRR